MRLYSGKVAPIAGEIVKTLTEQSDIETKSGREVQADIEAVLNQYLRTEKRPATRPKTRCSREASLPPTSRG